MFMRVEPNDNLNALSSVTSSKPAAEKLFPAEASPSFDQIDSLNAALLHQEEVRTQKIERAISLIGKVDWPPTEVIRRIATLVAAHLDDSEKQ
jgi:hypothetical protein